MVGPIVQIEIGAKQKALDIEMDDNSPIHLAQRIQGQWYTLCGIGPSLYPVPHTLTTLSCWLCVPWRRRCSSCWITYDRFEKKNRLTRI